MLSKAKNDVSCRQEEEFNWVMTRFVIFELENSLFSLPKDEIYKLDKLIKFHENLENYEICRKILNYRNHYV